MNFGENLTVGTLKMLLYYCMGKSRYYKHISFTIKEVPSSIELKEAYKTFLLLKNPHWGNARANYTNFAHPHDIYTVALHKNLFIPEKLAYFLQERHKREHGHQPIQTPKKSPINREKTNAIFANTKELSTHEHRSLLKSIGIMTLLLCEDPKRSSQFKLNNRPNAFRIAEAVLTKADALNNSSEGLKSLDRKIK